MDRLSTLNPFSRWLHPPNSPLGLYYQKSQKLIRLNQQWKSQKHIPLTQHSTIANITETVLIISVVDSGWATHLHYMQHELLSQLTGWSGCASLTKIKGYVQTPIPQSPSPVRQVATLSTDTKALLRSVGNTLSHSPLLKEAIEKLAR